MNLRRYIQAGAIWGWPLSANPLQEARDRHVVTGNPVPGVGPWGPYLTFDGANDYVTLGANWEDQLRFDAGTQDFSIVVWLRQTTLAGKTIFDKEDADNDGWRLRLLPGSVAFELNAITAASAPAVIVAGRWYCVIATIDRSAAMQIYIDGAASGAPVNPAGAVMATTSVPRIGATSYGAGGKFNGDIAGIGIIDRVFSPAECLGIATGRAF